MARWAPRNDLADLERLCEDNGIPSIPITDIIVQKEIEHGAYGTISLGKWKKDRSKIVLKRIVNYDPKAYNLSVKEMRFLATMKHANIVSMRALCFTYLCPVLEYVQFDLTPLAPPGTRPPLDGHSLGNLLSILARQGLVESLGVDNGLFHKLARDVAKGLSFLHANTICHRDMKPDNVLVANEGSHSLRGKLTDFGEARSPDIQTPGVATNQNLKRGTMFFYAPEQILKRKDNSVDASAENIDVLKKIDIWGYGLILFCMLNPDLSWPWKNDIKAEACGSIQMILKMEDSQLPRDSSGYEHIWDSLGFRGLYLACCSYDAAVRPDIEEVLTQITRLGAACDQDPTESHNSDTVTDMDTK